MERTHGMRLERVSVDVFNEAALFLGDYHEC